MLGLYRDFTLAAPDELTTWAKLGRAPSGRPIAAMRTTYCGPLERGERASEPLVSFGSPIARDVRTISYLESQSLIDGDYPPGQHHYWKAGFLRELSSEAVAVLVEHAAAMPSPRSEIVLEHLHGATRRVPPEETAFVHRDVRWNCLMLAQWSHPEESEANIAWVRGLWEAMRPHMQSGVYVNYESDESDERAHAAYGANYEHLRRVKRSYDPTNFFRFNQNIVPHA